MSRCLGERALLRVLERESARREEDHLRSCAACRARLRRLQADLDCLTAALNGPLPVPVPATERTAWRFGLPALALAALAALALLLRGGRVAAPADTTATAALVSSAGLGAALEGGDAAWSGWGGWNDWAFATDGDEVTALHAALHGARPCTMDDRMLYTACDETALADWSPGLEGEEVGR